jgi:SpoVK/Ycf46/Vps4 family AAA+-type ATPase
MKTSTLKSFHYSETGEVEYSMLETVKTTRSLDPGLYQVNYIEHPEYRVTLKQDTDAENLPIHSFPDKEKIEALLAAFFSPAVAKRIRLLTFRHKTGVLFYGKEGTGKSTIIRHYTSHLIETQKAVAFRVLTTNSRLQDVWNFVVQIRAAQNNPLVIIFDEFDEQMKDNTAYLKMMLDGPLSIDNCIFFASTNYLELIPETLRERPSRFRYVLNIEGIQSEAEIAIIVGSILGNDIQEPELSRIANEMKGATLDQIKQYCLDRIMRLRRYDSQKKIGFVKE